MKTIKRMTKKSGRMMAWILTAVLLCSEVPMQAFAQEEQQSVLSEDAAGAAIDATEATETAGVAETEKSVEETAADEAGATADEAGAMEATETASDAAGAAADATAATEAAASDAAGTVTNATAVTETTTAADTTGTTADATGTATSATAAVGVTAAEFLPTVSGSDGMLFLAAGGSGEVSRLEWLKALTDVFEMTVEENNYPDNYYSDIDATSEDYYDIMLATEFGLVDVEAGDPLRPDEAATREFAAHTLNLCLGYLPDESAAYTFSEAAAVTYPDDIQIAINKGWLELSGDSFLPEQGITTAEKNRMIAAAQKVIDSTVINPDAGSQYQLAAGVIAVPEGTEAALTADNEITLYDCGVKIAPGDIFVVVSGGFPLARRAVSVHVVDNRTVITVEGVEMEEAFISLETQGSMEADLTQIQAIGDDVQLAYIVGGTQEQNYEDGMKYYSLREVKNKEVTAVIATKTIETTNRMGRGLSVGDDTFKISCMITNPNFDWGVSLSSLSAYSSLSADITVSAGIDIEDLYKFDFDQPFVKVPIGLVGYFYPSVEGGVSGKVTFSQKGNFSIKIQCSLKEGIRLSGNFHKEAFTIQAKAEVKVGAKVAVGIDVGAIKAELYAKAGVKGSVKRTEHTDNQLPLVCTHLTAHLYVTLGGSVKVKIFTYKAEYKHDLKIYDEKNSPVKVALHYDDGKPVEVCGRDSETGSSGSGAGTGSGGNFGGGGRIYKYYTPINSQYAYSGINSGTTPGGEPFTMFEYSLDKEGNATITKYNGNVSALNIPDTLDGHSVVGIGASVFKNNTRLRMVVIPDSVTKIGNNAFAECSNLASVILSKNLAELEYDAFENCDRITAIEIPKSLQKVSTYYPYRGPFDGCDGLKEIQFEEGTTKIACRLFDHCPGIERVAIPDTVTVIEEYAFNNCVNLKEVMIPSSVTVIGNSAFSSCSQLYRIVIPDSVTKIGNNAFAKCSNLASVILSKNLAELDYGAFENCDRITAIEIPKSLQKVSTYYPDRGPFDGCDGLKEIQFEEGTTKIACYLFDHCPGIERVAIPDTVTIIEEHAFNNCENLKEVMIPSSVTVIGNSAFSSCSQLSRIVIPDSVTTIGSSAFSGCSQLSRIVIPDSVTKIGNNAFAECSNLASVILSKNLAELDYGAFENCDRITAIEIPKSLQKVSTHYPYRGPFDGCDGLKEIQFEEETTKIACRLFDHCPGIERVAIPDTVTVIEEYAFNNCVNLKEVKLSSKLTTISGYAFKGCSSLLEIDIPDTVTSIGNYVFADCSSLVKAKLPSISKNIVEGMFQNCTSLSSIELPKSVTAIQKYAFQNSGLTKIILPEKVERVEERAFQNCDSLTSIRIPNSVTTLGSYCFADCELLRDVQLGNGLTKIASYTFNLCPSLEKIVLPYRMNTLESNAFTNCTKLTQLTVPRAMESIGSNAFSYPTKMTVYGVPGTYAETWANSVNATFVAQEKPATAVTLSEAAVTVNKGSTVTLIMAVTPADFTDEVTWKSSNTEVATVSDTGVVTAKGIGEAVIQVNVGSMRASCKVTVSQPVTSISLNKTSYSMEAEQTYALTATVSPSTANDKSIAWSSSDESIATVDAAGKVTALRKGTATITATAQDGSGVSKSCSLTVTNTVHKCNTVAAMESPHNYENSCSDVWLYTLAGADKIAVTFDARTEVEDGFDFIYLYDAAGKEVGKYTGSALAGQTITIAGNTVKVKLVSDKAGDGWGFKVSKVEQNQEIKTVTGVISCPGTSAGNIQTTIQLLDAGGKEVAQTKVSGNGAEYGLENVAAGTYTLRVSRQNCVSRDYRVTLGAEPLQLDAEVCLVGDTNRDGKINIIDNRKVYNHIADINPLW